MASRVKNPAQAAGSSPPRTGPAAQGAVAMKTQFCTLERAIDYAVARGLNPQHWRIVEAEAGVRLVRRQGVVTAEQHVLQSKHSPL
jgi:hypothetical protein